MGPGAGYRYVERASYTVAPSNWSTPVYPNNFLVQVVIDGFGVAFNLNDIQVYTLTLSDGAVLGMDNNSSLEILGALVDNGGIVVYSNQGAEETSTVLNFGSGATVSGTGTINLYVTGNESQLAQLNGSLTQDAGHTIIGDGRINAALTNYGVVNAVTDVANSGPFQLELQSNNMTNYGLIEATTGNLVINGITLTQGTGGQLLANGGTVFLEGNAIVNGGPLNTGSFGGSYVISQSSAGAAFKGVTNNSVVSINSGSTLNLSGTVTDNGTILVNSDDTNDDESGVLNGNGAVVGGTGDFLLTSQGYAEVTGSLTQEANHTISGAGDINAVLTNYGIVNANGNSTSGNADGGVRNLTLSGNTTNYNLIESTGTGGGILSISGNSLTQRGAGQVLANGGGVYLEGNVSISGGALNTGSNGGYYLVYQDSTGATLNGVTNNSAVLIHSGNTLNLSGTVTDNGSIVVNNDATQNGSSGVLNANGAVVSGTGDIILNAQPTIAFADVTGTLTQEANHTISGVGTISATLIK